MNRAAQLGMTRRGFVGASAAVLGAATVAGTGRAYATGRSDTSGPPAPGTLGFVDAVLSAFKRHRVVAIGEGGEHGLQEHHDVLTVLLTDPRLPGAVNDVVVEFGNALYQPTVDRFISGEVVEDADLRAVWRNTTQSPMETWDQPVFERIYRTIRAVNQTLPAQRHIRVLLGDPPIDWTTVTTPDQLAEFQMQRDSHAAAVVQHEVLGKGRKALIVYGAGHVLHQAARTAALQPGLVGLVEQQTGEKVWTIATLVPLSGDPGGLAAYLARYPSRTVIPTSRTWLGDFDAGLVFPIGFRDASGQPVNLACGIPLASLIDAGLYVGQPGSLTVSRPNPASYLDPVYWAELARRAGLLGGMVDLNRLRTQQSVRFTPQTLPAPLLCGKG